MASLEQKLSRIDLNLLVALSVLLKERNVSRAADKLFISQSAMSRTLQRLRDIFHDPLFHRTSSGLLPTEKALMINNQLINTLVCVEQLFTETNFEPLTCESEFTISVPSLFSQTLMLGLLEITSVNAPHIKLYDHSAKFDPSKDLKQGLLDFCFYHQQIHNPEIDCSYLGKVTPSLFARKEHPLFEEDQLSLEQCLAFEFVNLVIEDSNDANLLYPIDTILTKHNLIRKKKITTSQFLTAIEITRNSNLLLAGPNVMTKLGQVTTGIRELLPLASYECHTEVYLLEHKRNSSSQAHLWMKAQIIEVFNTIVS